MERVRYPTEAARLAELRARHVPRLVLVEADADAPVPVDDAEDWIRVPADPRDVTVRVAGLLRRSTPAVNDVPTLDGDGILRCGPHWVALPPLEARLAEALLDRFGAVVGRETLASRAWPAGGPGRNTLDVHVLRLRRRVAEVGLAIRTVRSRGYLLESAG